MALLQANVKTLLDWAKSYDPDGKPAQIAELLSQTNGILDDMLWMEGNLPTGHRTTIRTGLPLVFWRLINQGVVPSKSTTAQVDEAIGLLEAWSEVDVELAKLNGDQATFRFNEAQAFIEAMNQEMAQTIFYGNGSVSPEEFTGLSVRYSDVTAGNKTNIIDAGGSGSDNTSIWLIAWGQNTIHGIFPKGSQAGLEHEDLGEETAETTQGIGGARLRVFRDRFVWKAGIALKDWRYVVRAGSIDVSDLVANAGSQAKVIEIMIKMLHRLPNLNMGKPVFYMNRTVFEMLDIQRLASVSTGGGITYENVDGKAVPMFRGIPIRVVDALLNTEVAV